MKSTRCFEAARASVPRPEEPRSGVMLYNFDLATVATLLSLAKTQKTALESVIAQLGSGSLFDRLQ